MITFEAHTPQKDQLNRDYTSVLNYAIYAAKLALVCAQGCQFTYQNKHFIIYVLRLLF